MARPKCVLFGKESDTAALAEALRRHRATVATAPAPRNFRFPSPDHPKIDFLFVSTELHPVEITELGERARDHNPDIRIILTDKKGEFPHPASTYGAHSLITLNPDILDVAARYWSECLYPP